MSQRNLPPQLPPQQAVFPSPISATNYLHTPTPASQLLLTRRTPTPTSEMLCRTTTPTNELLNLPTSTSLTALRTNDDSQPEEDLMDDAETESNPNDGGLIPNWFNLDISAIYDNLNPATKKGQQDQRAWRKSAIDSNGKAITSVGIIANRLLKILTGKKILPDTPLNSKLQSKKVERQQQLQDFLAMGSNPPALLIVQKFLSENICIPVNADGIAIDAECVTVNIGARVIMLAVEPDSYLALNDIFAAPAKEAR